MKSYSHTSLRNLLLVIAAGAPLWPRPALAIMPYSQFGGGCPFCNGGLGSDYLPPPPDEPSKTATTLAAAAKPAVAPAIAASIAAAPARALPLVPIPKAGGPPPEIKQGADGYWHVSFLNLAAFDFAAPPADAPAAPGSVKDIPENVRRLDGKRVSLNGYMLPLKMEKGLVKEFLLIRSPMMCCYGIMPAPNEWVVVKMNGPGTVAMMDTPLNFYGTLRVGEIYEDNMFTGIYRLDGEKVSVN
jgi:hypothetical protein